MAVIVLDFDGSVVVHSYPRVGRNIGAQKVLKELVNAGHKLVLFTMRDGKELNDAVNWFNDSDIPLYGVQTNPDQKAWTSSPKAHGDLFIDDRGLGVPLVYDPKISHNPFIDWIEVRKHLITLQYLKN